MEWRGKHTMVAETNSGDGHIDKIYTLGEGKLVGGKEYRGATINVSSVRQRT